MLIAHAIGPENWYRISTSQMQQDEADKNKLTNKIKASYTLDGTVLDNVENIKTSV